MKYLTVAIHDAAPPCLDELKEITHWLDQNDIFPRCLKVIPCLGGKWNILENREFIEWLLQEKEKGGEVIQHGFLHEDTKRPTGIWERVQNALITRNNAEFQRTSYEETKKAVEEGRRILKHTGIECYGFTSPTWYQSTAASKAIQDCGFRYYTSHSFVFDCVYQRKYLSVAMGFQGTASLLEYLAVPVNSLMRKTGLFCSPLARIVLHPRRITGNLPFTQSLKEILKLSSKRKLVTYYQYLNI